MVLATEVRSGNYGGEDIVFGKLDFDFCFLNSFVSKTFFFGGDVLLMNFGGFLGGLQVGI